MAMWGSDSAGIYLLLSRHRSAQKTLEKSLFFSGMPVLRVIFLKKMPEMADCSQGFLGFMRS